MTSTGLGVLISGRGSNLGALLAARDAGRLPIPLRVVLSDRAEAGGLDLARRAGVPALHIPPGPHRTRLSPEAEAEYVRTLRAHGADLVALAGFMRVLHAEFLGAFDGRILNIHPSLLPAFPGLDAPGQAVHWGVRWAGCTAHFVTAGIDAGPIVAQAVVPVHDDDTPDSLAARILLEEHRIYPEAVARVAAGDYRLEGRRVIPGGTGRVAGPTELPGTAGSPGSTSRHVEGEKR